MCCFSISVAVFGVGFVDALGVPFVVPFMPSMAEMSRFVVSIVFRG